MNPPVTGPEIEPEPQPQLRTKQAGRDEVKVAAGKIAVFQYAAVAVFLFLITGFWSLQIQNPQLYNEEAERNRIKALPIPAPRGRILDRDGRVIVDNHSSYSLILTRENLKTQHLRPIAEGLNLDYDDLVARVKRYTSRPKYDPIIIKEELSPAELSFVDSHREFFPEMELIHAQRRLYPQNGFAAHVIGYTGEISEDELDSPDFAKYSPGDVIGKFGIERQYNDTLMGVDGERQVVVDNLGKTREVLADKEAVPGKDLQLTLDLDLQAVAELAMEGKNGAVVAMDPRTGEVLAMVSRPTFDPNKFAVRIKPSDWKEIADNPDHPLLNRAIQGQLAPGSTFKPFVAIAGLESGAIDDKFTVHCTGGAVFYGKYRHCWWKPGHGTVALHGGIVHSCDVYFYTVGDRTGIDKIAFYAEQAGFGQKTGIDLPHEAEGIVPSSEWKIRNYHEKWYAGETISVAIGQGALTVTPLQLASGYSWLINGGLWRQPHLVKGGKYRQHSWPLAQNNVQDVIDGTWGVVNEPGGTGVRAALPGLNVCGKTGTAQLASTAFLQGRTGEEFENNSWFVGFAPRQAPEIVVVAIYEHGGHGQFSAPIVRDVLKAYFDKKARLAAEAQAQQHADVEKVSRLMRFGLPGLPPPVPQAAPAIEAAMIGSDDGEQTFRNRP
ncbi:MAG TPA: penicillin-binding protein 2 [Bryobacteraceae bacterium]|nr:penicillin-binding protein 2 [Bryobacteraceae bacterium]